MANGPVRILRFVSARFLCTSPGPSHPGTKSQFRVKANVLQAATFPFRKHASRSTASLPWTTLTPQSAHRNSGDFQEFLCACRAPIGSRAPASAAWASARSAPSPSRSAPAPASRCGRHQHHGGSCCYINTSVAKPQRRQQAKIAAPMDAVAMWRWELSRADDWRAGLRRAGRIRVL